MKIFYYIGQPGTGKTTLMRGILNNLRENETDEFIKEGLVTYHKFLKQKTIVLGRYDEGTFAGTDTWSKGVGPKFREWLLGATEEFPDWIIYGEGERLSNGPNMDAMFQENIGMNLICLQVSEEELERRRAARNNTQNESWMKGMRTRIENLCKKYPHKVETIE
jgi:hypothetical protein